MTTNAKKATSPLRRTGAHQRPLVFRGIKIAPIAGKRSPVARAIREALQSETAYGEPPHA